MNAAVICGIIFIVFLFSLILFFGVGEHVRKTYTLQEFTNVDTKKASFSLTTTPSRINGMEPTIKNLVAQNPKTIYLNVLYVLKKTGESYIIPKWLDKYKGIVTLIIS